MFELAKRVLVAGFAFAALDYVWLGLVMRNFYLTHIGSVSTVAGTAQPGVRWVPAVIAYALLALGMALFVIPRAGRFLLSSFTWGAAFGFVVYGVYNCANLTFMQQWPVLLVAVDMAWGIVVCGAVSVITAAFSSRKIKL